MIINIPKKVIENPTEFILNFVITVFLDLFDNKLITLCLLFRINGGYIYHEALNTALAFLYQTESKFLFISWLYVITFFS